MLLAWSMRRRENCATSLYIEIPSAYCIMSEHSIYSSFAAICSHYFFMICASSIARDSTVCKLGRGVLVLTRATRRNISDYQLLPGFLVKSKHRPDLAHVPSAELPIPSVSELLGNASCNDCGRICMATLLHEMPTETSKRILIAEGIDLLELLLGASNGVRVLSSVEIEGRCACRHSQGEEQGRERVIGSRESGLAELPQLVGFDVVSEFDQGLNVFHRMQHFISRHGASVLPELDCHFVPVGVQRSVLGDIAVLTLNWVVGGQVLDVDDAPVYAWIEHRLKRGKTRR